MRDNFWIVRQPDRTPGESSPRPGLSGSALVIYRRSLSSIKGICQASAQEIPERSNSRVQSWEYTDISFWCVIIRELQVKCAEV